MKRTILIGASIAMLSGCVTDGTVSKKDLGTGAGAIVGAAAGSLFGQGGGRIVASLAGAAIGGFIGNQIGSALDEQDRLALQAQAKQALLTQPDGSSTPWTSAKSDAWATIVPRNTRFETRKVKLVRDAGVAPAPKLDLIGARYVATGNANVRQAPTTDSAVATSLPAGSTVWAIGKMSGQPWIMVARDGKSIGYVHASLLSAHGKPSGQPPAPSAPGATQVAAAPSTEAAAGASNEAKPAAFDLDAEAPVRTVVDLDNLPADQEADVIVASVMCRDIETTASVGGETVTDTQIACKAPDGTWELD